MTPTAPADLSIPQVSSTDHVEFEQPDFSAATGILVSLVMSAVAWIAIGYVVNAMLR